MVQTARRMIWFFSFISRHSMAVDAGKWKGNGCFQMNAILTSIQAEEQLAGLVLTPAQRDGICAYLRLLQKWGQRINLTADPSPERVVSRHLPDALYLYRKMSGDLGLNSTTVYLDVGSGAGLPGLLVAVLLPGLQCTLVESIAKKCTFLRTVVHELGLSSVQVVNKRLEPGDLFQADIVSSRATWSPETWLQRAAGMLRSGGIAVVFTAGELQFAPDTFGFSLYSKSCYRLTDGTRRVQTYLRYSSAPSSL